MQNEKTETFAQIASNDTHLFRLHEGLLSCAQACLSEWLQVLLVIERIKADKKDAAARLKMLIELAECVYNDPLVGAYTESDSMRYCITTDPLWNVGPAIHVQRLNVLDTLFTALDSGQARNAYLTGIGKKMANHDADGLSGFDTRYEKITGERIPAILDKLNYSWQNLNDCRLHYPHETIVRCVLFNQALLDALSDLQAWINMPVPVKNSVVLSSLLERNKITLSVQGGDLRPVQRASLRGQLYEGAAIKLISLITAISSAVGLRTLQPLTHPQFPLVANKAKEKSTFQNVSSYEEEVVTFKCGARTLRECIDKGNTSEFYLSLEQNIADILYPGVDRNFTPNDRLPLPVWAALNRAIEWSIDDESLLPQPASVRINYQVIMTGVKFSHWLWNKRRNVHNIRINQALDEYLADCADEYLPARLTIKQYYDQMRSWSRSALAPTVKRQLRNRSERLMLITRSLLQPLNIDLLNCYNEFIRLIQMVAEGKVFDESDVDSHISLAKELRSLLESSPDQQEIPLKAFICAYAQIEHQGRDDDYLLPPLYGLEKLQQLVALNLDQGW